MVMSHQCSYKPRHVHEWGCLCISEIRDSVNFFCEGLEGHAPLITIELRGGSGISQGFVTAVLGLLSAVCFIRTLML